MPGVGGPEMKKPLHCLRDKGKIKDRLHWENLRAEPSNWKCTDL